MKIKVVSGDITSQPAGAIVVNLFEGVTEPGGATGAVDRALGGAISSLIQERELKGRKGELTLVHTLGKMVPARVLVAGLGKESQFSADRVRTVSAEACRYLRRRGVETVATIAHGAGIGGMDAGESGKAIAEGAILGLYRFDKYKTSNEDTTEVAELTVVESDPAKVQLLEEGVSVGSALADAVNLCRNMANEPANYMTPTRMAEVALEVAQESGLEIEVLDRPQLQELGMGAMKGDMAGGASVICAMKAIGALKPKINVTAVVPATENMPGGSAQRPGDVVKAMSGKTIEIDNTDAEGRLILADAVTYARSLGLDRIVDVATLTGAIEIALGKVCIGAFGNDQQLMDRVLEAAQQTGERTWQMPMFDEYKEQFRSGVADIKNVGGRAAGSITGAQIIGEFADGAAWVHLDIASTSRSDSTKGYNPKGATGVPLRTLVGLALNLADAK